MASLFKQAHSTSRLSPWTVSARRPEAASLGFPFTSFNSTTTEAMPPTAMADSLTAKLEAAATEAGKDPDGQWAVVNGDSRAAPTDSEGVGPGLQIRSRSDPDTDQIQIT